MCFQGVFSKDIGVFFTISRANEDGTFSPVYKSENQFTSSPLFDQFNSKESFFLFGWGEWITDCFVTFDKLKTLTWIFDFLRGFCIVPLTNLCNSDVDRALEIRVMQHKNSGGKYSEIGAFHGTCV